MGLLQHVKLIRHIYPVASNHFLSLVKTKINYANLIEEISCQNTEKMWSWDDQQQWIYLQLNYFT